MGCAGTGGAWLGGMQTNLHIDLSACSDPRGYILARLVRAFAPEIGALVPNRDKVTAAEACMVRHGTGRKGFYSDGYAKL